MKSYGGYTRAKDGCIVTFLMPDGSTEVQHFSSVVRERRHTYPRTTIFDRRPMDLVIEWADEHEAKILSISSPDTILRDLQGTRAPLEAKGNQKHPADVVLFPEYSMLGSRGDLFVAP
jgi:hypothetical protein